MNVAKYLGINPPLSAPKNSTFLFVNSRNLGFEAEREGCENIYLLPILSYFNIKEDGSLRRNGVEFVFKTPVYGSAIIDAFKELGDIINLIKPSHSYRTSDHFHVDICDFNEREISNLFNNSLLLENTLFNFGTLSTEWDRKTNSYCMPVSKYLSTTIYPKGFKVMDIPKYLGFRFSNQYGTIEYRMFNSTDSILMEITRANVLLELVEYSKNIQLSSNLKNIKDLLPKSYKYIKPYISPPTTIETEFTVDMRTYLQNLRAY